ncbi:MAG: MobF family relaxase [Pseudomonadota bacterium]
MLSIGSVSSGSAGYYAKDNYYADARGEHLVPQSHWFGKGASELGLQGAVSSDAFSSIMLGQVPDGPLLGRTVDGERHHKPGYDLTFSAPKSVSIAIEALGDKAAGNAHDAAVHTALKYIEAHALQTRVFDRETRTQQVVGEQKMVAALFRHDVSRALDPQTHTHAVLANMVQGQDRKWRSIHSPALFEHKMLAGAIYRAELAAGLKKVGYEIERTHADGRFEIVGMPKDLIQTFSTRAAEIRAALEGRDEVGAEAAARAALITRSAKQEVDRIDLSELWRTRAREAGHPLETLPDQMQQERDRHPAPSPSAILDKALAHLTERDATFTHMTLLRGAIAAGVGHHSASTMIKAVDHAIQSGRLFARTIDGEARLTTPLMVRTEQETIAAMQGGHAAIDPIALPREVAATLKTSRLSTEQKHAVTHLLASADRTVGIQGYAGTGKTTMLKAANYIVEEKGLRTLGLAPSASAAQQLSDAVPNTMTIQRFLTVFDKANAPDFSKTVLIVDEASMISTWQMRELINLANAANAPRLALVGDVKQLDAVEAGTPFDQLQRSGMGTVAMTEIRRQRDPNQLESIQAIAAGELGRAFEKTRSSVIETPGQDRAATAADAWLNLAGDERRRTTIVAQTHTMRREITAHLRGELKEEGALLGPTAMVNTLTSARLTRAQMRDPANYRKGQTVLFNSGEEALGVERGARLTVQSTASENGSIELFDGKRAVEWNPKNELSRGVEVFDSRSLELAAGDQVRWTRNDETRRFLNSEMAKVEHISGRSISFQNEDGVRFKVARDDPAVQHMDHGWVSTLHAMQGRTTDQLIVVMDAHNPQMTTEKAFYVALSRARDGVTIVTEDTSLLKDTLERESGVQLTAIDLAEERDLEADQDQAQEDHEMANEIAIPDIGMSL